MTMKFARSSPNKFMELVFGKLLPRQEEREQKQRAQKDAGIDEITRMIEELNSEEAAEWKRDLLEDTSGTVIDAVQKVVFNWKQRSDVEVGLEASEKLELLVIELVNKTITVAVEEPEVFRVEA